MISRKNNAARLPPAEVMLDSAEPGAADDRRAPGNPAGGLTGAEKKVLSLLVLAQTNKEIAQALGISPATVKRHLENILRKRQLRNRVAAAIYGLRISGCSRGADARCPLEEWHKAMNHAGA